MRSRLPWVLGFLGTVGAMAFALYLEHGQGLEPCPMCIFQRVAMIATGFFFLLGALFNPQAVGAKLASGFAFVSAGTGAAIAGRHVWLQNLPEDEVPACGSDLAYMLDVFPFTEVLRMVLTGDGNCAKIDWSFLGLSLPGWVVVGFVVLGLLALLSPALSRQLGLNGAAQ